MSLLEDWTRDLRRLGCGPELTAQILQAIERQDPQSAAALLRQRRQDLLEEDLPCQRQGGTQQGVF